MSSVGSGSLLCRVIDLRQLPETPALLIWNTEYIHKTHYYFLYEKKADARIRKQ